MKSIFLIAGFLLTSGWASSQIIVEEFVPKQRVEVGEEDSVEAPEAHSDCGPVKMSFTDMLASGGCAGTIIRTYVYSDECGNEASAQQFFHRVDYVGPYFTQLPEDVAVKRKEVPEKAEVAAEDKNGMPVEITFEEKAAGPLIVRMWTAKDSCGNETLGMQRITLLD